MLAIFINQADVSALTVISVRAVLAQVVLVEKLLLHSACCGGDGQRVVVHERDFLQDYGIVDCFVRVLAPGERTVALYENRRNAHRVNSVERFNYNLAGLLFVLATDLLRGHSPGAGDLAVEVVALGGAHRLDSYSCLRK